MPRPAPTAGPPSASPPSARPSTTAYDNFYIASNRDVRVYDQYLQTGPYNFGFPTGRTGSSTSRTRTACSSPTGTRPTRDNNTSQHPGEGLILPIDAHPTPIYKLDGTPWRRASRPTTRRSGWRSPTRSRCTRRTARPSYIRGQNAQPVFDDSKDYYREDPATSTYYGVKVPNNGVKIQVISENGTTDEGPRHRLEH